MRFSKFLPILLLVIMFAHACTPSVHIYKRSQMLMGTVVEITVVAQDGERAEEAMTAAFKEIRRLEEIMSTYIPSSDISGVNAAAGVSPVKVHKDLILVVKKALEFAHLSRGAFNIALGPAIDLWNVTESDRIPSDQELEAIRPLTDLKNMSISTSGDYARFFIKNGIRYHHVLSPDTLHPSRGNQSVSVIAQDSTTADAISTAIFAMDPEKGFKLLKSLPEVEGIIMGDDGHIGLSSGLKGHPKVAIEIIH